MLSDPLRRRLARLVLVALTALASAAPGATQSDEASPRASLRPTTTAQGKRELSPEYQVKAAILHKFVKYTDWPKDAFENKESPIVIEVIGTDPFLGRLRETFKGKKLHDREIVVRHSRTEPEKLDAHLVFMGDMSPKARVKLIARCAVLPVLLVGDEPNLAVQGAAVSFYISKGKVRFEINPDVAKVSRLKISSKLIKLARVVRTKRDKG
jgi:hypothetical protein